MEEAIQQAFGMSSAQLEQAIKDYFHAQTALLTALDAARQEQSERSASCRYQRRQPGLYHFPVPVGSDDSAFTTRPIPEADARALYAEVAIRIPERRDSGLQQLKALASAPTVADKKFEAKKQEEDEDPDLLPTNAFGSPLAHRILAWDHIEHNEFDEATTPADLDGRAPSTPAPSSLANQAPLALTPLPPAL